MCQLLLPSCRHKPCLVGLSKKSPEGEGEEDGGRRGCGMSAHFLPSPPSPSSSSSYAPMRLSTLSPPPSSPHPCRCLKPYFPVGIDAKKVYITSQHPQKKDIECERRRKRVALGASSTHTKNEREKWWWRGFRCRQPKATRRCGFFSASPPPFFVMARWVVISPPSLHQPFFFHFFPAKKVPRLGCLSLPPPPAPPRK
jgi:hypothetical protein